MRRARSKLQRDSREQGRKRRVWGQLSLAVLLLVMLLVFGTELANSAAGCFHHVSTPVETEDEPQRKPDPATRTTIKIVPKKTPKDVSSEPPTP
jgi:uncharacterized protein involved in cysteine biosynthesis